MAGRAGRTLMDRDFQNFVETKMNVFIGRYGRLGHADRRGRPGGGGGGHKFFFSNRIRRFRHLSLLMDSGGKLGHKKFSFMSVAAGRLGAPGLSRRIWRRIRGERQILAPFY